MNGTAHAHNGTTNSLAPNSSIHVPGHDSTIHNAFLITAILTAAAAFPSLYVYFKEKDGKTEQHVKEQGTRKTVSPAKARMIILGILYVISFLSTSCGDLFPSFFTSFLIEQLNWEQKTGAILTSIYFGTYGLGNLIAAITSSYIQTTTLLLLSYATTLVALATLLLSVLFTQTVLLWISVACFGLTSSVTLPTLFPWVQENVTLVTGRIASALLFFGSAGVMANPPVLGYFMDNFTPMWFLFLSIGQTLLCAVLFILAFFILKKYSRPVRRESIISIHYSGH